MRWTSRGRVELAEACSGIDPVVACLASTHCAGPRIHFLVNSGVFLRGVVTQHRQIERGSSPIHREIWSRDGHKLVYDDEQFTSVPWNRSQPKKLLAQISVFVSSAPLSLSLPNPQTEENIADNFQPGSAVT